MRVFSPGWNFSPPNRAENSAPLCSQLFVKLEFVITWEVFSPGWKASPGWNFSPLWAKRAGIFSPGKRAEISHIIANFSSPGWEYSVRTRIFSTVCAKTTTKSLPKLAEASESSKERFQWKTAGDEIANLIQCLATNQSQMEFNCSDFNGDKVNQYEAVCRVMAIIYKANPSYFGPPEIRESRRIGEHRTTTSSARLFAKPFWICKLRTILARKQQLIPARAEDSHIIARQFHLP